jgi:hypothetical protein
MPNLRLAPPSATHGGDGYLVVWNENTSACGVDYNLRGQRLSMTGVNLGQPIAINSAANMQALPTVAFDGEKYLVTWTDGRAGIPSVEPCPTSPPAPGWCFACPGGLPGVNVYGQFVSTTGELLYATGQPEFLIPISVRDNLRSTVAFGGGKYLLTWNVLGEFSGTAIWETYWATMNP